MVFLCHFHDISMTFSWHSHDFFIDVLYLKSVPFLSLNIIDGRLAPGKDVLWGRAGGRVKVLLASACIYCHKIRAPLNIVTFIFFYFNNIYLYKYNIIQYKMYFLEIKYFCIFPPPHFIIYPPILDKYCKIPTHPFYYHPPILAEF